jgi:hypothetical protein
MGVSAGSLGDFVSTATLIGTYIECGNAYSDDSYLPFSFGGNGSGFRFIGCTFDVSQGRTSHVLFAGARYGWSMEMIGCKFVGLTPNHRLYLQPQTSYAYGFNIEMDGIDLGSVTPDTFIRNYNDYAVTATPNASCGGQRVVCNNVNGAFNYKSFNGQVYESWVDTGNYPTLNAVLPTGTPWSIKVMPAIAHLTTPAKISGISKLYLTTAAAKTLTFELAIHENYGTVTKKDFYVEVAYFDDATGDVVFETTEADTGNLATSSATWSPDPPVYGSDTYVPYKIELTTSKSIKQNSLITARIVSTKTPIYNTDYYFIDPDFSVS